MTWTKLADRIAGMPLVLAGPILRKATAQGVTVWLALKAHASVVLEIRTTDVLTDAPISFSPATDTTKIGPNLHLVAVTVDTSPPLQPGSTYFYHLRFQPEGPPQTLAEAVGGTQLSYTKALPSFALPPTTLTKLRIVHGSCRKPNADGPDALALLDEKIRATETDPLGRPHQLVMSGDQIYADEVADVFLMMLSEAGVALIGVEPLPLGLTAVEDPRFLVPTDRSGHVLDSGFTTVDRRSHLLSLGEFLAMYLFVWSDVMWPPLNELPDEDDLIDWLEEWSASEQVVAAAIAKKRWMRGHFKNVIEFRATLPNVRRALANVPTYMIFDDHDVTDDWNMYESIVDPTHQSALGLRLIQNALCAYALCQHWGNAPEQFRTPGPHQPAGKRLLDLLHNAPLYRDIAFDPDLRRILGVHTSAEMAAHAASSPPFRVYHETGLRHVQNGGLIDTASLLYHYVIEGPAHVLLVTDTRTWRSFPRSTGWKAPDMIAKDVIPEQIEGLPALAGRQLIMVASTNLVTGPGMRQGARDLPRLPYTKEHYRLEDLSDSWEPERIDFLRLLRSLARRVGRSGSVVVLSGDVHASSAARIRYWADAQVDEAPPFQPADLVIAQLIGSPFHNGNKDTNGQHYYGYAYVPNLAAKAMQQHVLRDEKFIGWLPMTVGSGVPVAERRIRDPLVWWGTTEPVRFDEDRPLKALRTESFLIASSEISNVTVPASYRILLNYLRATTGSHFKTAPIPPEIPLVGDPLAMLAAAGSAAGAHRTYTIAAGGGEIVGQSSLGDITFGNDVVTYLVWFGERTNPRWVQFDVSLALQDEDYPFFTYPGEAPP